MLFRKKKRLTEMVACAGWASKLAPAALQRALSGVDGYRDPNVLIGYETADDAGVYLLGPETALVQTADFFTPIVDDPFIYGQIAAANALSDVYAMGGVPKFALCLVGFPEGDVDEAVLHDILRGGADKMKEARVSIIGGHSVKDPEIKFGYAVTGTVDPRRIHSNNGARPGDALLLTKPLGTGIVATAVKYGKCPPETLRRAMDWMLQLNAAAAAALADFQIGAVTDVTGYGLLGHAYEVALASGVCLEFEAARIPLIEGVEPLARRGLLPGGIESNQRHLGDAAEFKGVDKLRRRILFDPQTSGGLLISVRGAESEECLNALRAAGCPAARVGQVATREKAYIRVFG